MTHNHIVHKTKTSSQDHEVLWLLGESEAMEVRGMQRLSMGNAKPKTYVAVNVQADMRHHEGEKALSRWSRARRVQWVVDMVEWLGEGDPKLVGLWRQGPSRRLEPTDMVRMKVPQHGTLMLQTGLALSKNQMRGGTFLHSYRTVLDAPPRAGAPRGCTVGPPRAPPAGG